MNDCSKTIEKHYSQTNLGDKILDALKKAGKDINNLALDDIASFDEFHLGGRRETRKLARMAKISQEMHVLDIGCGVGGPARTLAAEFDCQVTGLDLSSEFCLAAEKLTERIGLSHKIKYLCGNALNLPFYDSKFQIVWTQHTSMNLADKEKFYREVYRVLKPGGRLVFHDILKGPVEGLHYPVYWASDPTYSFLISPSTVKNILISTGFKELVWKDVTEQSLEIARRGKVALTKDKLPLLGINVIVAKDVSQKAINMVRNLEEERMLVVQAIYQK